MRRNTKTKTMAIIALIISVLGLTLGFAAFSNTLTISSSATVSPDASGFNISVYGLSTASSRIENFNSSSTSVPKLRGAKNATTAKITDTGKSITLSDLSVEMTAPGEKASYLFMIKNEGEYDAYLNNAKLEELYYGTNGTCIALENTTPTLVENACEHIILSIVLEDEYGNPLNNTNEEIKIEKGKYILAQVDIFYHAGTITEAARADGDFTIDFEDISLEFSSVSSQS